jgi:hypothetical protein
MFDDTYKTLADRSKGLYTEKGSRFIALAFPVENEDQVKQYLADIRKSYYDARHHSYAYILGAEKMLIELMMMENLPVVPGDQSMDSCCLMILLMCLLLWSDISEGLNWVFPD